MAIRLTRVLSRAIVVLAIVIVALIAIAVVLTTYYAIYRDENDTDPFHSTLVVSGSEANSTDGNLTDVVVWVAVASGGPKPSWSEVEVVLETASGNETLVPPKIKIDDQDGDGRVTEGDLLDLFGLSGSEMEGRMTLFTDGRTIGTVKL